MPIRFDVADEERSRDELIAELEELRADVEELRSREKQRAETEENLRRELHLVSENAKTAANIRRSTVTLTNKATGELRQAKRKAEAAALAKIRFLANMSHELRTPMTAILGYTDSLLEEGDLEQAPPERIEQLNTLKRNGRHLMHILNDILDLSKIEASAIDVELVWVSPFVVLADIERLMRNSAESKHIALEFSYEGSIPSKIYTDPTRLRQILMNLVGNAVKFTESGGVRIVTKLERSAEFGIEGVLHIAVSDTGCGLSPEALERIFDAFSQADASTTRRFGGTGLGLTISRQLAEMLRGDIEVESIEEQGSTFVLTIATGPIGGFPLITDPDSQAASGAEEDEESDATENTVVFLRRVQAQSPGVRVLLVEDGADNRRLISFTLKKAGFEVAQAENGEIGVELALAARDAGLPFDVVLMDMQMPVMDGYEATARLRQAGMATPIIALTAHAMSGDRQRCLEAGCDDFATKPIERKPLIRLILHYVGRTRAAP